MERLPCEDRLRELELLILEKKRLQRDFLEDFYYLQGAYRKTEEGLFKRACIGGTFIYLYKGFKLSEVLD